MHLAGMLTWCPPVACWGNHMSCSRAVWCGFEENFTRYYFNARTHWRHIWSVPHFFHFSWWGSTEHLGLVLFFSSLQLIPKAFLQKCYTKVPCCGCTQSRFTLRVLARKKKGCITRYFKWPELPIPVGRIHTVAKYLVSFCCLWEQQARPN